MMACSCFNVLLIFCFALFQVSQSQTDAAAACAVLDCSLSTYILIGIAVFYTLLSILCIVLIVIACNCKKRNTVRSKSQTKVGPTTRELDDFYSNLDPIQETATTTDLDLEIFENPHAQEHDEIESKHSSSSSSEEEESSDDDSDQNTSVVIKNPSASSKRHKHLTHSLEGSPLLHHQPKSSPIPPAKVKVPYSESRAPGESLTPSRGRRKLPPLAATPNQRVRVAAAGVVNQKKGQSPFSRRKDPLAEIPKDNSKKSTPKVNRVQQLQTTPKKEDGALISASTLKFEMVQISHKWRSIGEAFQLPSSFLNNISIICNDNDMRMTQVCTEWLKLSRDWAELVDILKSEKINEKKLAKSLKSLYLKSDGSEDSLVGNSSEGNLSWYYNHGSQNDAPGVAGSLTRGEEEEDEPVTWID